MLCFEQLLYLWLLNHTSCRTLGSPENQVPAPPMSKSQVRIFNPVGRNKYTSLRQTERLLSRGLARRRPDGSIEIIESDHRSAASHISSERLIQIGYDRDVNTGAVASLDAIRGLPCAGDVMRLLIRRSKRSATA